MSTARTPDRIVVADYGMGNLFSIKRAVERVGGECVFASKPEEILSAARLILPGVGAFGDAMVRLQATDLGDAIRSAAAAGTPILGICLGMQLLLSTSDEFGQHEGLGIIPGSVVRFADPESGEERYKIPHVGWATVLAPGVDEQDAQGCRIAEEVWAGTVLDGFAHGSWAYFVHSLYAVPDDSSHVLAESVYGGHRFCSAVRWGRVFGCQFHPEMSGDAGLAIYRDFLGMTA